MNLVCHCHLASGDREVDSSLIIILARALDAGSEEHTGKPSMRGAGQAHGDISASLGYMPFDPRRSLSNHNWDISPIKLSLVRMLYEWGTVGKIPEMWEIAKSATSRDCSYKTVVEQTVDY